VDADPAEGEHPFLPLDPLMLRVGPAIAAGELREMEALDGTDHPLDRFPESRREAFAAYHRRIGGQAQRGDLLGLRAVQLPGVDEEGRISLRPHPADDLLRLAQDLAVEDRPPTPHELLQAAPAGARIGFQDAERAAR